MIKQTPATTQVGVYCRELDSSAAISQFVTSQCAKENKRKENFVLYHGCFDEYIIYLKEEEVMVIKNKSIYKGKGKEFN